MSIEATLCCDECGEIITAAETPAKARSVGREEQLFKRIKGQELCARCVRIQYPNGIPRRSL